MPGAVAQLGERCVRNAEVEGSTPFRSTLASCTDRQIATTPVTPGFFMRRRGDLHLACACRAALVQLAVSRKGAAIIVVVPLARHPTRSKGTPCVNSASYASYW